MKTLNHVSAILVLSALLLVSCQKNTTPTNLEDQQQQTAGLLVNSTVGEDSDAITESFCNARTTPLCAGQTIPAGEVSIQTSINGRTYITYATKANWYIKE